MYLEILWELGMILAIIYVMKSKFIKTFIIMFVFSIYAYSQNSTFMQDSIFVIRKNNIIGTGRCLEIDSETHDSLLSYVKEKKVSYVCLEPYNEIAILRSHYYSMGHYYTICTYYDDKSILCFRSHWMSDVEWRDVQENETSVSKETVGTYLQPATINIQEDDIASYITKDSIVSLREIKSESEYNVSYTYFKIKEEAKKKYEDINFCNYLNVVIMGDTFSIVTYLKHKNFPQQKAIRHGTQIIGKDDWIETMKVRGSYYNPLQNSGNDNGRKKD